MADVDNLYGWDEEEFRRRVPFGGITGGVDPSGGIQPAPEPANQPQPEPQPAPQPAAFNPFGGEEEARTQASLNAFRNEARARGLAVDQGDREAYAQMQAGFGSLPSLVPEIAQSQAQPLPFQIDNGPVHTPVYQPPPAYQPTSAPTSNLPAVPYAPSVPDQFDDPYTNLLEQVAKAQMGQVRDNPALAQFTDTAQKQMAEVRSNPALDQLTAYLNQQFQGLSQNPGYSADERAILNTQAFEPIEEQRKAAQQRSIQRMAARGFLPSSGIGEIDARNIDQDFDKLRTVANRDLAVQEIDRRDADLERARQIATVLGNDLPQAQRSEEMRLAQLLGTTIPQQQRTEELALANLLYGLPRNALSDSLAVLNGSPNTSSLYQGAGLLAQQQELERRQNEQRWNAIAQFLAGLTT